MVHSLSNSGYSVNVEIVTIHMFLKNLVSRYSTQKYTGNTTSNHLIEIHLVCGVVGEYTQANTPTTPQVIGLHQQPHKHTGLPPTTPQAFRVTPTTPQAYVYSPTTPQVKHIYSLLIWGIIGFCCLKHQLI